MKRNIYMILSLIILGSMLAKAQNDIIIKGSVNGDFKGYNKVYVYGNSVERDSTMVQQDGKFEFKVPFKKPMVIQLYCEYEVKLKNSISPVSFFVDQPGTVYYNDANLEKGFHTGKVSGMKSIDDMATYNAKISAASKEIIAELAKKYGDTITPKSPNYMAYYTEYADLNRVKTNKIMVEFIKANPDVTASSLILTGGMSSMSPEELENTYQLLSKRVATSEFGSMIDDFLAGTKSSAIGNTVNDFTLNDPNDKPISLSQLKGKYVMIDFWASWCGPCKASFPHMKELYEKYKGDKFEIYSISVDQSKQDWLNELKKQNLPWLQALDTKKIAKSEFAVNGIPTIYLIDPEGKILTKTVGLDPKENGPVEKMLIEIFEVKK